MARALLVDDDPIGRRFLADALASLGFDVIACADAGDALRAADGAAPDLVVLDLRLPDATGGECLARLRGRAALAAVPAIALTAALDAATAARARADGFDAVAAKPIGVDALGRLVAPLVPRAWLDDGEGARATGSPDSLAVLRALLARELPGQLDAIDAALARDDRAAVREVLHRLRGAAAFCGALALSDAAAQLAQALDRTPDAVAGARARLRRAGTGTLAELLAR